MLLLTFGHFKRFIGGSTPDFECELSNSVQDLWQELWLICGDEELVDRLLHASVGVHTWTEVTAYAAQLLYDCMVFAFLQVVSPIASRHEVRQTHTREIKKHDIWGEL